MLSRLHHLVYFYSSCLRRSLVSKTFKEISKHPEKNSASRLVASLVLHLWIKKCLVEMFCVKEKRKSTNINHTIEYYLQQQLNQKRLNRENTSSGASERKPISDAPHLLCSPPSLPSPPKKCVCLCSVLVYLYFCRLTSYHCHIGLVLGTAKR